MRIAWFIDRALKSELERKLSFFPAIALLGPRQVGKTTLAFSLTEVDSKVHRPPIYLDLELPTDRAKLADAELYLAQYEDRLVIFDEIHRLPGIFQILRGLIDRRRRGTKRNGHFLLLGSASMELMQQSSESLAGRIAYEHLTPFLLNEVLAEPEGRHHPFNAAERLWMRGGFPDSYLARDDRSSLEWRLAFIQTYLERDVPALGPRIPAATLHRYWQMLAHHQGQLLNNAQLAGSLGVSGTTVARYLDVMIDLLLVRKLLPWTTNLKKRLVRSPKVYVRDSGLVHALLGIRDQEELLGHPVLGSSWEGWVIENILNLLPESASPSFYRSAAGAEIDLVLEWNSKERWAIEVKRSISDPSPSKGFYIGCEDIKATRQMVVYPGYEAFPLNARTQVLPLQTLLQEPPFSTKFGKKK